MATVVKWFASLIPACWFGFSGMDAIASTSQALVEVRCVHLDAPADAYIKSGDFVSFRVESLADVLFIPGEKAHAQGLYLMSELAKSELICLVDGTPVALRVVGYKATQPKDDSDVLVEDYQL